MPPNCYITDSAFLRTLALCLDTYYLLADNPPISPLEDYWSSHLATGTLGDYQWQPDVAYLHAVAAAREDKTRAGSGNRINTGDTDLTQHVDHQMVRRHNYGGSEESVTLTLGTHGALPTVKPKLPLNVTSFIAEADWQKQ